MNKRARIFKCIGLFLLLAAILVTVFLAYGRQPHEYYPVTDQTIPPRTEAETFSEIEKQSIQDRFDAQAAGMAENAAKEIKDSKAVALAVKGVSKGIDFGKKLAGGDQSYIPEDAVRYEFVLPYGFELAEVTQVIDGDTLLVNVLFSNAPLSSCYGKGEVRDEYVRLIGVDTPESDAAGKRIGYVDEDYDTTMGNLASEYTRELVEKGQIVWLQTDTSDRDRYGRLLRYVWLDEPKEGDAEDPEAVTDKTLNAMLLIDGIAVDAAYDDRKYEDLFRTLCEEAERVSY